MIGIWALKKGLWLGSATGSCVTLGTLLRFLSPRWRSWWQQRSPCRVVHTTICAIKALASQHCHFNFCVWRFLKLRFLTGVYIHTLVVVYCWSVIGLIWYWAVFHYSWFHDIVLKNFIKMSYCNLQLLAWNMAVTMWLDVCYGSSVFVKNIGQITL